jgi:hypothetical protein
MQKELTFEQLLSGKYCVLTGMKAEDYKATRNTKLAGIPPASITKVKNGKKVGK